MSKATHDIPDAALALYDKLVATQPEVERKGAAMPYTSVNGHMFSFLTKEGRLALRLPAAEREAFLKDYDTTLCKQNGVVLKEYVEVPAALLKRTQELSTFFGISHAYVAGLNPKPTTKKARPAKKASRSKKPKHR